MTWEPPVSFRKVYQNSGYTPYVSNHLSLQSRVVGDHGIRVSVYSEDYYKKLQDHKNIYDLFKAGLAVSRNQACLGSRSNTDLPYSWMSYEKVNRDVICFGSALDDILTHDSEEPRFIGIYSRNSPEWIILQLTCAAYSFAHVPLHDPLRNDATQHILNQTRLPVLICQHAQDGKYILCDLKARHIKCLIVVTEDPLVDQLKQEFYGKVEIFYFHEIIARGQLAPKPIKPAKPDDLLLLCYTSGSTGIPKGVQITQQNLVSKILSMADSLEGKYLQPATTQLSYLPMFHIYGITMTLLGLFIGSRTAFSTSGPASILADLRDVQPTVFAAVPHVLRRFQKEFDKKIDRMNRFVPFIRGWVEQTINRKNELQAHGNFGSSGLVDYLILSRFRAVFGNRVSLVICAGAPLLPQVSRFCRAALGVPVLEAYGSTETTGPITCMLIGEPGFDLAGAPMPGNEIRLVDVPDMDISVSRDQKGEICCRGLGVTRGYYKDPENTAALFTEDGFLRLGDIGSWTENGSLKIEDRCKNLFKLSRGEYISPEKMENIYQLCDLVLHVFVDGESTETFAIAIVQPDLTLLRAELEEKQKQKNWSNTADFDMQTDVELCSDRDVRAFVLSRMNTVGVEHGLTASELVKSVYLCPKAFTTSNGFLTPTLKLARHRIRSTFKSELQALYKEKPLVN